MADHGPEEKEFRARLRAAYDRIAKAYGEADPDVAEFEESLGSITITTPKGKIIVSPQPPVRQIWLAAASQGIAVHFSWDGTKWMDDKGKGLELYEFLSQTIEKASGLRVTV